MNRAQTYDYDASRQRHSAATEVVRMAGTGKRVLEIGAGPGSITRLLKEHGDCRITALELDASAIEKLAPYCESVHQSDLNNSRWTSPIEGKFQVIVAADVLEHLHDPEATLGAMKDLLDRDGYIIVSLPHVGYNGVLACLIQGDFAYNDHGILDKTHVRFFCIQNIQRLLDEAQFNIIEAQFIVRRPERTEFADFWRKLPSNFKRSLSRSRYGMVYQVVIKAKPALPGEHGLNLADIPIPSAFSSRFSGMTTREKLVELLKSLVLPFMSLETQERLGQFLKRVGIRY